MKVIKRSGKEVNFDLTKIVNAIYNANLSVDDKKYRLSERQIMEITEEVVSSCESFGRALHVEEIQDMVEVGIMKKGAYQVAKNYITYRFKHSLVRSSDATDSSVLSYLDSNANNMTNAEQKDHLFKNQSQSIAKNILLDSDIIKAQEDGELIVHDMEYLLLRMNKYSFVNLADMLQNGTKVNNIPLKTPTNIVEAASVTSNIIQDIARNQSGISIISFTHLASFVDLSRRKIKRELLEDIKVSNGTIDDTNVEQIVSKRLKEEIREALKVLFLGTTNLLVDFIIYPKEVHSVKQISDLEMLASEALILKRDFLKRDLEGPRLIYVMSQDALNPKNKENQIARLFASIALTSKEVFIFSEKKVKAIMLNTEDGIYGKFDQGVISLNLASVACKAEDARDFYVNLDDALELAHRALMSHYDRLFGSLSDIAPILWQEGALARLKKGEKINKLLKGGHSTASISYAGLREATFKISGYKLSSPEGVNFAKEVLSYITSKMQKWSRAEGRNYQLISNLSNDVSVEFCKKLQKRYGMIKDVLDKGYVSNQALESFSTIGAFINELSLQNKISANNESSKLAVCWLPKPGSSDDLLNIMKYIYENELFVMIK